MFSPRRVLTRAAAAVATVLAGAAITVVATGTPAQAATPKCNAAGLVSNRNGTLLEIAVYRTSPSAETPLCGMYQGDQGEDVIELQWALDACYSENIAQDGSFGAKTRAALVRAQSREHISADGNYGPQTARALLHPQSGVGGCGRL